MVIDHTKRFAFFRVPKTGSSTVEFVLRLCGGLDEENLIATPAQGRIPPRNIPSELHNRQFLSDRWQGRTMIPDERVTPTESTPLAPPQLMHMTPAEAVENGLITLKQLRSYTCCAFVRDPLDRFISGLLFLMGRHATPELGMEMLEEGQGTGLGLMSRPQRDYFFVDGERVGTPLDFRNFDRGVRHLVDMLGGYQFPYIPNLNRTPRRIPKNEKEGFFSAEQWDRIRAKFDEDVRFWGALDADWSGSAVQAQM